MIPREIEISSDVKNSLVIGIQTHYELRIELICSTVQDIKKRFKYGTWDLVRYSLSIRSTGERHVVRKLVEISGFCICMKEGYADNDTKRECIQLDISKIRATEHKLREDVALKQPRRNLVESEN